MIKTTKKLKTATSKSNGHKSTSKASLTKAAAKLETAPAGAQATLAPAVKKVEVQLVNPGAKAVAVAGSFNGWNPDRSPLTRTTDGKWVGDLTGIKGRHEYLFVVDGQWVLDPNAKESVQNPFGGRNSVLVVSE
jgi:1,4-alpha-glucan branching enzyme